MADFFSRVLCSSRFLLPFSPSLLVGDRIQTRKKRNRFYFIFFFIVSLLLFCSIHFIQSISCLRHRKTFTRLSHSLCLCYSPASVSNLFLSAVEKLLSLITQDSVIRYVCLAWRCFAEANAHSLPDQCLFSISLRYTGKHTKNGKHRPETAT